MEPRCAPLLSVMAFAIPCTSVHACICGYYYGKEKVSVPAAAQLFEQTIRIFTVFLLVSVCIEKRIPVTVSLAVFGLVAGEAGSALFVLIFFLLFHEFHENTGRSCRIGQSSIKNPLFRNSERISDLSGNLFSPMSALLALAAPLMANRLILNLLQSAETIMIPERLTVYGLTRSQAVSTYGTLTGMAMPFVLFPSALVNSLAVVLLPATARHQSAGNDSGIAAGISMSFRYSLYLGIFCIGVFTVFGDALGLQIFKSQDAGSFIQILAWLCPFLYLSTTMGSILNGLGKTGTVFIHHTVSMLLTLSLVLFAIPRWGIFAYLAALLISELVLAFLHIHALACEVPIRLPVSQGIVKPAFCLLVSIGMLEVIPNASDLPHLFPPVLIQSGILCLLYIGGLLLLHTGTVKQ